MSRGMTRRSPRGTLLTPGNGHRRAEPKETFQAVRSFTGCETPPAYKRKEVSVDTYIYVQAKDGTPPMPTKRHVDGRLYLMT